MLKRAILVVASAALIVSFASAARAQGENATLVLKSGEKFKGQLLDLGGVGLTFRYGGVERQHQPADIAVVEFEGAPPRALNQEELKQLNDGQHVIVFRDGRIVVGHFTDVGEAGKRITVTTQNGLTNHRSQEIWQIFMAPPPASYQSGGASGTTPTATSGQQQPSVPGAIVVPANQQWVATGIIVRRGETVRFNTTGEVQLSPDANDKARPAGAMSQRRAPGAPLPGDLAGALIGRIGNGQPFGIGNLSEVKMPESGPLYLGINDDQLGDNNGQFEVVINRARRR